mmetsp:Transcript_36746/g.85851  ORF Transcript_36746/g.85851 Transcript_36746/m.85851 type:complete len:302 (+) Transcript_36746:271-1176(+)
MMRWEIFETKEYCHLNFKPVSCPFPSVNEMCREDVHVVPPFEPFVKCVSIIRPPDTKDRRPTSRHQDAVEAASFELPLEFRQLRQNSKSRWLEVVDIIFYIRARTLLQKFSEKVLRIDLAQLVVVKLFEHRRGRQANLRLDDADGRPARRDGGDRTEDFPPAGAVGRAAGEEEGDVGPELCRPLHHLGVRGRSVEKLVETEHGRGGVAGSPAEASLRGDLFDEVDVKILSFGRAGPGPHEGQGAHHQVRPVQRDALHVALHRVTFGRSRGVGRELEDVAKGGRLKERSEVVKTVGTSPNNP